jgi:hypothetical protein
MGGILKFVLAGALTVTAMAISATITPTANAHAPWKHEVELRTPKIHFISYLRRTTNEIREDKCRGQFRFTYSIAGHMPEEMRDWAIDHWKEKLTKARALLSICTTTTYGIAYSVWDRLAQCESGGNWSYDGPSGFDGGLQFHPGTWSAYRLPGYPAFAYQASREQQIAVAERVLASQGWGAWPACSAALGLG